MDADDVMWTIGFAILMIVVGVVAWNRHQDQVYFHRWVEENCRLVRHEAGQTVLVSTGNGVGVGGTADRNCYRCPSGVEECF